MATDMIEMRRYQATFREVQMAAWQMFDHAFDAPGVERTDTVVTATGTWRLSMQREVFQPVVGASAPPATPVDLSSFTPEEVRWMLEMAYAYAHTDLTMHVGQGLPDDKAAAYQELITKLDRLGIYGE